MYDVIIFYCKRAGFSPKSILETALRLTAIVSSLIHAYMKGTLFKPLTQPAPITN